MGKIRNLGFLSSLSFLSFLSFLSLLSFLSCSVPPSDPVQLRYVPGDAAFVAYAKVAEIMRSEVGKQVRPMLSAPAVSGFAGAPRRFQDETGIDVERDVDDVVVYVMAGGTGPAASRGVVIARGRFDEARLEKRAAQQGGTIEPYKGKRLIRLAAHGPASGSAVPERELALGFVQPGLAVVGSSAAVRSAVDREDAAGTSLTANEPIMSLIHDNDGGSVWAAGSFAGLAEWLALPSPIAASLPEIRQFAASGQIDTEVRGQLKAEGPDEQAAQQLHGVVGGLLTFAKMQSGARPDLQAVLQSFQLRLDGRTVVLSFVLPASALSPLTAPRAP